MVPPLTDAELTILGLLAEQPRHGYELENVIEERGVRNWTALGFSSIYYILDKLARRKLIEAAGPQRGAKSRVTFRVTELGHQECAAASLEALTALTPLRARVLIGLANSPGLPESEVAAKLAQRSAALRNQLAEVRATRQQQEPLPAAASAIFDYGEALLLADAQWTESTYAAMKKDTDMEKYDVKKAHKELYSPTTKGFTVVHAPAIQFLAIDGHGDPNTSAAYAQAVEALYTVAYTLKFTCKKTGGRDFTVGPLEGLWRADDAAAFTSRDKDAWSWTMMISQPDWITPQMFDDALGTASSKKPDLDAIRSLRLITLTEGQCVQILHIGSYDDEAPTLERLHHQYMPENGLTFNGDHHEIYLSDARRTPPAKLKTILRQPVRPA